MIPGACRAFPARLASPLRTYHRAPREPADRPRRRPPVSPFREVDPAQSFPALEEAVIERWRERNVFHESVRRREGGPRFVFYEGPPTANGRPGSHHVLSRVFKDVFPRYKTMRGHVVHRKAGWDCHGLPVELEIERELGIASKADIERYGIAEFNARCRESVFAYIGEWNRLTERIGFWIDTDDAYVTLSNDYIESVWWSLREVWRRGLLYEGHKVVPYCPRCGTALSSHEVAQGYRDVVDPSVYVRFPVRGEEGVSFLGWTTTPWTLLSNAALAVDPDTTYVRAQVGDEVLILAEALAERVLGEGGYEVAERMPGSALVGTPYEPPFSFVTDYGERGHTVLEGDFVTTDDGTGVVHTAVAFGEDDFRLGERWGLKVQNPVLEDGTFDSRMGPFAGRFVKDADADIVDALRESGRLFRSDRYEHAYPHCWRCGTPLLYYAKRSWYVKTTAVREAMLAANETIAWHPEHIKHGRFGDWLAGNVDWALSRERYWGTPLPVWRCDAGHERCVGSRAELAELAGGAAPDDLHKPFIDEVVFGCEECDGEMRRVPEVIDAWWDSGSMPFAQWHAPFENDALFAERFPADYICEALDQTRGWFYSLLAISVLLYGQSSYRTVLCLGLILDPEGQKMSKSRGNVVEPWEVIDRHGADAFRWYYFTSKQPWDGYRFSVETVGEAVRQFMLTLWSTYRFFVLYANVNAVSVDAGYSGPLTDLDRWALSRLQATTATAIDRLDGYDTTSAGRAVADFVEDLSNWYVRRSRRRFWDGDEAAFFVLWRCIRDVSLLLAPLIPFVTDEIYENLDGTEPSVHLCDYPEVDAGLRDPGLERDMQVARDAIELGRAARAQAKIKVRQPLAEAVVVAAGDERAAIERFEPLLLDELNVKRVRFVSEAEELGRWELKPNYRTLGPRFGKQMPQVAAAVAALDAQSAAAALREGGSVGIAVDGHEHALAVDDVQLVLQPLEGYRVERSGTHAVALNLELDGELRREGLAREAVHAIQAARKQAGLEVEDRIALSLGGDPTLLDAVRTHEGYVAGETLATSVAYDGAGAPERVKIEGRELAIGVARA
ncbi:MAG: isoleucine--tRNA ligase [Actinobacteria bacterium]|nr:isoleucine--tRNA ligase [Actinomycetota bacterium]